MNPTENFDDEAPFVREECGDTMWDDNVLNQLTITMNQRPPLPPFTLETARQKVQVAEDAWNTKDPERVSLAYTPDTEWRNRTDFINGREEVKAFLTRKWAKELDYRLKKELWGFRENRMAVRFEYEWHDESGQWYRSYGNELWEFDENGLMAKRYASINDAPILETERRVF
ncbi:nuclear transport factor 2 family protein [Spirosoma areae]